MVSLRVCTRDAFGALAPAEPSAFARRVVGAMFTFTPADLRVGDALWLAGKTAVVTGAASGIGLQVAAVFAKAGATVAILDLSGAAVDAAANTINSSGRRGRALATVRRDRRGGRARASQIFAPRAAASTAW